tara:strand:- start:79 stop:1176 length:1098 start_codon:yes stop_codon:yes gene_type:complete
MKILVTGSDGFIAKNLILRIRACGYEYYEYKRSSNPNELGHLLDKSDIIFHLAGVNRSTNDLDFEEGNINLTQNIVESLLMSDQKKKIIFSSTSRAEEDTKYGHTKLAAEEEIKRLAEKKNINVEILRLPNVFGKWSRPDYNSVVATFIYRTQRNLPIKLINPKNNLDLLYIDDLVDYFLEQIESGPGKNIDFNPVISKISVEDLLKKIKYFYNNSPLLDVGIGFDRKLYATFLSFKDPNQFKESLSPNIDDRGSFTEVIKSSKSGQLSYFTATPGITRGGHYHETKNEKFIVVNGKAKFRFKNMSTDEKHEIVCSSENPEIVESIPGWSHDITNIGTSELIVMLWSNEIFDPTYPDTYSHNLGD